MTVSHLDFTIAENPPNRLDKALFRDAPVAEDLSRTRLGRLIGEGAVTVNGDIATNPKAKVRAGANVKIKLKAAIETETLAQNIPLDVVYEDAHLIVINKAAGMVVHPAPGSPSGTLVNALLHHCADSLSGIGGEKRPGIVHRIDKDTTGLLVVAKNDKAHHALAEQFSAHSVERLYQAVCFGYPDVSEPRLGGLRGVSFEPSAIVKVTTQLARHKTDRQRQAVLFEGGRHAITRVRVRKSFGSAKAASLVDCWLETGRTHQIRVHLAHIGHGIIGDTVYGGNRKIAKKSISEEAAISIKSFSRQALHAAVLGFKHPESGKNLRFSVEIPQDMHDLLSDLQGST
jgi:23S rRNA pseudouridine1911/1915/1917 synthase